jgi:transaldolase/glucose-6-phosphate isomerase
MRVEVKRLYRRPGKLLEYWPDERDVVTPIGSFLKAGRKGASGRLTAPDFSLGQYREGLDERLRTWEKAGFSRRLWLRDPSLWTSGPSAEIRNRLGWLDLPEAMEARAGGLDAFAEEIKAGGFSHAVLLGMGGSSLAPEVFQRTFGNAPGYPELIVLDSTHPAAVAAVERKVALPRTLFIFSSKSGTTVEPLSFFRYFWDRMTRVADSPGRHFIAITDPGTPLAALARDRNFRRVFEADADVGGRFSALTEFGLVPAALVGLDIRRLLASARAEARANGPGVPVGEAQGLLLGAALGETAGARDKLTILTSPSLRSFPDWLEQLIAESTGKNGKGIIPVAGEPALPAGLYGQDRVFVSFVLHGDPDRGIEKLEESLSRAGHPVIRSRLEDPYSLGREIFRWEIAVAAAGSVLGVHPFNQPDVELAKELARKAMARGAGQGPKSSEPGDAVSTDDPAALKAAFDGWLAQAGPKDYIALQAYLAPGDETGRVLEDLRLALLKKTGLATTLGYGPRFLHSTGQLHKGGPAEALVLQLVDEPLEDLAVPETDFTFGALIRAQALGDFEALRQKGRRVVRANLKSDPVAGIGLFRKWTGA